MKKLFDIIQQGRVVTDIGRVREKRISVSPAIRLGEIEAQSFSKQKLSKTAAEQKEILS